MNHSLDEFEAKLKALVGSPTNLRPFVCDGNPLACRVFIVGFNPATTMEGDFWEFWQPGLGFKKAAWFKAYREDRLARPLKPGQRRRNAVSNTRRVMEWIMESAPPISCLETNLYSAPTEKAHELSKDSRITAPFDFLLSAIAPSVIVTHGQDAERHVMERNVSARVIPVSHFSRGWSVGSARELGEKLKAMVT